MDGINAEVAIQMLEEELIPHSELSHILDKTKNYDVSVIHHKQCVTIIESIQVLKKSIKGELTFDYTKSHAVYG